MGRGPAPNGLLLTPDELDAGLAMLLQSGSCDLLPTSFEAAAVKRSWTRIRPILEAVDLRSYIPHLAMLLGAPKDRFLMRPIHVLDPLDVVLFTGLVRRIAADIEAARQPESDGIVFSHRFRGQPANTFALQGEWPSFQARLQALCAAHAYVAVGDISDFFPNAYLHRLQSVLSSIGRSGEADVLDRWLQRWSTPLGSAVSQGLPVGHLPANLLSEAALIATDAWIADKYDFVRYADDYYIFCDSHSEAVGALYKLAEWLMIKERLFLNAAKTRVRPSQELCDAHAHPPAAQAIHHEFVERILGGDPYEDVSDDELDDDDRAYIAQIDALEHLAKGLQTTNIDFARVRLALHVMTATADDSAIAFLVANLQSLAPVVREVSKYFSALARHGRDLRAAGAGIIEYITRSHPSAFEVVWLLEPFVQDSRWNHLPDLRKLSAAVRSEPLAYRQWLLALSETRDRPALMLVQDGLSGLPVVRRASLFGLRHLPKHEREHQWKVAKEWTLANCIEKAVIDYARAGT